MTENMASMNPEPFFRFSRLRRVDLPGIGVLLLLNLVILWLIFGNMLLRLNQVSFARGGDGLKSYYSVLYHVRHDRSYHWLEGMNYPFGEHIFYTDSQPLVSSVIKWISGNITDISDVTPGVINAVMLISIVIGSLFIYLILRKSGVPVIVALLSAAAIPWLSPQLGRMGGHFSLALVSHIPGAIFFLMLYAEKPASLGRSILVACWAFLLSLTHFYFFGIMAILLFLFWLRAFLRNPQPALPTLKKALHLFIQLILPFLILQLYLHFTDPVTDRPGTPWGFMHYRAYPESVLLPLNRPYCQGLTRLFNTSHIDWEGYAYAGGTATFLLIGTVFFLLYTLVTGRFKRFLNPFNHPFTSFLFWAGFVALLYSFAVPFVFKLEWMLKYLGPMKQIRGIARFAWLFFYVMQPLVVILLWRKVHQTRKIGWMAILAGAMIITSFEAYINSRSLREPLDNAFELTKRNLILQDPDQYQAIVPLPYFHVGSENYWWEDRYGLLPHVLNLSVQYGIPTTGVYLSRTSLHQTMLQMGPFLKPCDGCPILDRYSKKNLLLFMADDARNVDSLGKRLAASAEIIGKTNGYRIGSIPVETYRNIIMENQQGWADTAGFVDLGGRVIKDIRSYSRFLVSDIPAGMDTAEVLFRVEGIDRDMIPRIAVQVVFNDPEGNMIFWYWQSLGEFLAGYRGHVGYHTIKAGIPENASLLQVYMSNGYMKKQSVKIKQLQLRFHPEDSAED